MSEQSTQSVGNLERWEGGFPGEHEFSTLEGLKILQNGSDELDTFFSAARKLTDHWQGNRFAGLYLYGTPGTGKTHAAIGLGRQLHEAGAEVHYRYVNDLPGTLWTVAHNRMRTEGDLSSPFPQSYTGNQKRNPKSVLILDDYKPIKRTAVAEAIEAGAQFGGLVVITSNYEDPFKLVEPSAEATTDEQALQSEFLKRQNPEAHAANKKGREQQEADLSASLRSRIAAGFKFIEFAGPDHRITNSFWN